MKSRLMKRSMAVEHTTSPVRSASHTTGLMTPTETRYRPGGVVIIGSHCKIKARFKNGAGFFSSLHGNIEFLFSVLLGIIQPTGR